MQQDRVLELSDGQGRVEVALEALLEGPDAGSSLVSVFQDGSKLLDVQVSGVTASVDIDFKGNRLDNREWLIARLMIADTVISADESIAYVNVYINGYEQGYYALPLGAATAYEGSIAQYIEQLRQKYGLEYQSGEANDIFATLYFTDETDQLLLAEARSVDIKVGDEVENADYDVEHIKLLLTSSYRVRRAGCDQQSPTICGLKGCL
jgi:hypothetical protein